MLGDQKHLRNECDVRKRRLSNLSGTLVEKKKMKGIAKIQGKKCQQNFIFSGWNNLVHV